MRSYKPRNIIILTVVFFLVLISHFLLPTFSYSSDSADVVRKIEVEGLTRIEEGELIDLICIKTGSALKPEDLSTGIKRAYKKGVFLDIRAEAEPLDDGIRLRYVVKEIPVINKISIAGNKHISGKEISRVLGFESGDDLRAESVHSVRLKLIEFYDRRGYPDTGVDILAEKIKDLSRVNILITVREGRPLIIDSVEMPVHARSRISLAAGRIFDKERLERDITRLKKHYKKKGHINPQIGPYRFIDGKLVIPVSLGPKLELVFRNNKVISSRKLRKEVHFIENEELTDESIAETAGRIKKLYMSKGYYYAQVAAGVEMTEDAERVTFMIFEGQRVKLKKISYSGVSISSEAIKKVVTLVENKPFDDSQVESSRESIVRFYNALGYLKMDVIEINRHFSEDGGELEIEFVIHEGVQTKIRSIEVTGNNRIDLNEIRSVLNLEEGIPYNSIDIGDARYRLLSLYSRHGHINARVNVKSKINGKDAFLKFEIQENRPSIIGKIILRGNRKTKNKIIMREISIEEGDTYNYDKITQIKQRLYKLGIFNEVSVDILEPTSDNDTSLVRDMMVSVKEGKAGAVEFGFGYGDYEQFRGSFDISYRNLGGYNRLVGFRTELSSVEQRFVFNFKEPWLFNKPNLPFKAFLIKENKRAINIETRETLYKIDKFSFIAGIEKDLGKGLLTGFNYEYSYTDTQDVQAGVILSKEDTGTLGIGSISPSIFYDTRDNPFDPTSGSLHGIVLKYASHVFLSETEFIKATFQSAWFFPLIKRLVLAVSFKGGAAFAFEGTKELPLIERFFLGGRSTVRGYSNDTLGPKGEDGSPTGGNVYVLTNAELRYSLWKGFGLVTFLDCGNVWKTADDIGSKLRYTAGAGLRYKTPVGPIRIDYGHKINREAGESSGEVHFSFGHAF